MNIKKYKNEYITSLYGKVYDPKLKQIFPTFGPAAFFHNWDNTRAPNKTEKKLTINDLPRVYIASDHHFDHKNIIRYANRPFKSVDEMNEVMVERHNSVVSNDDIIILGGDISFGSVDRANKFLDRMNGYKIMIMGNHDWNPKTKKVKEFNVDETHMSYYLNANDVCNTLITHVPFVAAPMIRDRKLLNFHGHIHENTMNSEQHINVCVEHTEYFPVPLLIET